MSVYLYTGGLEIVRKSGVGQAILHQKSALEKAQIKNRSGYKDNSYQHSISRFRYCRF